MLNFVIRCVKIKLGKADGVALDAFEKCADGDQFTPGTVQAKAVNVLIVLPKGVGRFIELEDMAPRFVMA